MDKSILEVGQRVLADIDGLHRIATIRDMSGMITVEVEGFAGHDCGGVVPSRSGWWVTPDMIIEILYDHVGDETAISEDALSEVLNGF